MIKGYYIKVIKQCEKYITAKSEEGAKEIANELLEDKDYDYVYVKDVEIEETKE